MFSVVTRVIKVFGAECKNVLHDEGVALLMIGAVCLYSLFYIIPFHNHVARNIPIAVIDNDDTSLSRSFIRTLNSNEMLNVVDKTLSLQQAREEFYKDNIKAFIEIPKNFQKDIKSGKASFVSAYLDGSFLIVYKQMATGLSEITSGVGGKLEIKTIMKKGVDPHTAKAIKTPFEIVSIPLFNPIGSYQNYIYPQVLIMVLQQTLLMGISVLIGTLSENMRGIFRRHKKQVVYIKNSVISPYTNNVVEIVLGKGLSYSFLYLIYALVFFQIFPTFVNYRMVYNLVPMLALMIPFILSTSFLGITLGLFCRTRESGMFLLVPSSVPFIFLPGFVWAKECIPPILSVISKIVPTTSAIDGLLKVNQMGASLSQVKDDVICLCCLTVVFFITACFTMKKIAKVGELSVKNETVG